MIPESYPVHDAFIEVRQQSDVVATIVLESLAPGLAVLPPGIVFNPDLRYTATATVNAGDSESELVSATRTLQPASIEFVDTGEVDDEGPLDFLSIFDAQPLVTIDRFTPTWRAGVLVVDVGGTVRDRVAPVQRVLVGNIEASITSTGDPMMVRFSAEISHPGTMDVFITATAVNALGNTGWASRWVIRNQTIDGGAGVETVRERLSVPSRLAEANSNEFRIEVRNAGLPLSTTTIRVNIQTDAEEKTILLRRQGPSLFSSDRILPVTERYVPPLGMPPEVARDLDDKRIRIPVGTAVHAVYGQRVLDRAIAAGIQVIDERGSAVSYVSGRPATPTVEIETFEVDPQSRSVRVTGQVVDPVARVLPDATPTVSIGPNALTVSSVGNGVFRFDGSGIPLPLPTTHVVVRVENATGAFGLAGRIVSLEGPQGLLTEPTIEDDGLGRSSSISQSYRLRVWAPKMAPDRLSASVTSSHSQQLNNAPVSLTFVLDAAQPRAVGVQAYLSRETLLPATLPTHSFADLNSPESLPPSPVVPVETGGLVNVTVAVDTGGQLQRAVEVSGVEIVTPRDASVINAAQMLMPDGSGVALPVTLKWHGLSGATELIETVPGLSVLPYEARLPAFAGSPYESIGVTATIAAEGEEVILTAAAQDVDGTAHLTEAGFFTFTPETIANPTPFADDVGNWVRFRDTEGVWLTDGVFLMPGVIDGLELLYPGGTSDREISEHLRKNQLRPIGMKRNAGTLVAAVRVDGRDVLERLAEGIQSGIIVDGKPPTPVPDQAMDGDDVTWHDIIEMGLDDDWDGSYLLAHVHGVRRRSEIIQQVRARLGLPPSEGGLSREYKDLNARAKKSLIADLKFAFFSAVSFLTSGAWAVAFGVLETTDDLYTMAVVGDDGQQLAAVAVPAAVVIRPKLQPSVFYEVETQGAHYRALLDEYLNAQKRRASARSAARGAEATGDMVLASAKLGDLAAREFAEIVLGLDPTTRVCCGPEYRGGGATGKFDVVYSVDDKFYILEAKGGKRYASLLYGLSGRRIAAQGGGYKYALQGTQEYITSVAEAMADPRYNQPEVVAVGEAMMDAIRAGEWHRFEHYFVSARWRGSTSLRIGRGLARTVAPLVRVTKSILF